MNAHMVRPATVAAVCEAFEHALRSARNAGLRVPAVVRFGPGVVRELGDVVRQIAADASGAVLLVGGWAVRDPAGRARWAERLGRPVEVLEVHGEPDCGAINEAASLARRLGPRLVVGMGGGSAIDAAKALAAMARHDGRIEEYLEGAEPRRALEQAPLPVVAVPTTAGTGAEMTRNAVIGWTERRVKRSLRDDRLVPAAALIDSELTYDLPAAPTLWSGLDALTQLIEACISGRATAATTELALRVVGWIRWALPVCLDRPRDALARAAMSAAASLSGVCLANAGLAMAHGIAAALGAIRPIPHGLACGLLLPHTLRYNRDAAAPALARVMAAWLGELEGDESVIERGLADLNAWYRRLGVPGDLRAYRISGAELDEVAVGALGRSMEGNPVPMTADAVRAFLKPLL